MVTNMQTYYSTCRDNMKKESRRGGRGSGESWGNFCLQSHRRKKETKTPLLTKDNSSIFAYTESESCREIISCKSCIIFSWILDESHHK